MKTNPNDSTQPLWMRQVGENEFRAATERDMQQGAYLSHKLGLTKREYFAVNSRPNSIEDFSLETSILLMGSNPPTDRIENFKWWLSLEAKIAVMRADALIIELNKETEQPTNQ